MPVDVHCWTDGSASLGEALASGVASAVATTSIVTAASSLVVSPHPCSPYTASATVRYVPGVNRSSGSPNQARQKSGSVSA
jgi:hypothetical protein